MEPLIIQLKNNRPWPPVITIDGWTCSGKTTAAKFLAGELGLPHIDLSEIIACIGSAVMKAESDEKEIVCEGLVFRVGKKENGRLHSFAVNSGLYGKPFIEYDGKPAGTPMSSMPNEALCRFMNDPDIVSYAETIASRLARLSGGIVEGRTMAFRLMDRSCASFYLYAGTKERADRIRWKNPDTPYNDEKAEKEIDAFDRAHNTPYPHKDAIEIDTEFLSEDELKQLVGIHCAATIRRMEKARNGEDKA